MKLKRILATILCFAMVFGTMSFNAFAEGAIEVADLAGLQKALASDSDLPIVITDTIVISEGDSVVIDLNGKTVTVPESDNKHIYAIDNQGDLTLMDSQEGGSVTARGIYNGYRGNIGNAKLTVESGTYVGMDTDGGAAIFNGAELIINGGEFYSSVAAINNALDTADTTINDGVFGSAADSGRSSDYIIQNKQGSLTINYANVVSGFGAVGAYGGTTVIHDGSFLPTGWGGSTCHVVYVGATADVTINGGTFKMNYPADDVPDSGSAVASYHKGTLKINGGDFFAHFDNVSPVELSTGSEITGGTFMNHSGDASNHSYITKYVPDGYKLGEDGKVNEVCVAYIGTTGYKTFEEALAAACEDSSAERIEIVADSTQTEVENTEDYYYITHDMTIGAPNGENHTVSFNPDGIAVCVKDGATFTIEENVTLDHLDIVANGFATTGENMNIDGTLKALSLKQWTNNGTITVSETGKVWLGFGDGQFDMAYGNGTVTINGNGNETEAQFKAGYSETRGNGNVLNLKDTWFEGGAWFNVNGSNGTFNVDNSLLKVSGGDYDGTLTVSSTGNKFNLTNGAKIEVSELTLGAGNELNIDATSVVEVDTLKGAGIVAIDAANLEPGATPIIGDVSGFTGNFTILNNDSLCATLDANGNLVLADASKFVATVNGFGYTSLEDAIAAAKAEGTVALIKSITTTEPIVITKDLTLNGNGNTITYTSSNRVIDVPDTAKGANVTIKNLDIVAESANRGINYNTYGELTVENVDVILGANVDSYAINFPSSADNATVEIKGSDLTARIPVNVWGSDMQISIVDTDITSVDTSDVYNYSGIQLNNDGTTIADGTTVTVTGGSITALKDDDTPSAAVSNWTSTGTVTISDTTILKGEVKNTVAMVAGAGYYDLQSAIDSIVKHGYTDSLTIIRDITLTESVSVPSEANITIDLNGRTIAGTDNSAGSFGLINIQPGAHLTINDSGTTGKITLVATNDRSTGAYSSVISNQRGKLTVNGGTIEHLGGTYMAYGIDNLTNGNNTYAETVINGGTVKSTYRAIRQFLNGIEAQNILKVNGGTIEGANKSIWMQDSNANANPGTINVSGNAVVKGDIYLSVASGSTQWPVAVSIAASALDGNSTVVTSNVPQGYVVEKINGNYGVTIVAADTVAVISGVKYTSLQTAIDAATNGCTITLAKDCAEDVTVTQAPDVKFTIDGSGKTMSGTITVNGKSAGYDTAGVTIKNFKFDTRGISKDASINLGGNNNIRYTRNVTVENCTFTGEITENMVGIKQYTGGCHNLVVTGCTADGMHSLMQLYNIEKGLVIADCVVTGSKNGISLGRSIGAVVENCTITTTGYGIRADGNTANAAANIKDCTITSELPVVVRKNTLEYTLTMEGTNTLTASNENGYGVIFTNGDDGTYETPAGEFDFSGGANIKVYPATASIAKIGDTQYSSLQAAFDAVQDDDTITLLSDITINENTRYNNNGWFEGVYYEGDKTFVVDLNKHTITQNSSVNDYLILLKNEGTKANEITFKNGTIDAGTTAFCAVCTSSSSTQQITVNLENVNLIGNNSNGSVVKVRGGTVLNVKDGTVITGKDSYLGIESSNATVNIYDGAEIYMNGTSSYNGCLVGVGGNGTINVHGGYGKGAAGGFIAMTSGGTINVYGGEWIADTDGTFSGNDSVLIAQNDKNKYPSAGNSIVNVTGGSFTGSYNCYGNAVGDAQINISGGTYSEDPTTYVAEDYKVAKNGDGTYSVVSGRRIEIIADDTEVVAKEVVTVDVKVFGEGISNADWTVTYNPNHFTFEGEVYMTTTNPDGTITLSDHKYNTDTTVTFADGGTLDTYKFTAIAQPNEDVTSEIKIDKTYAYSVRESLDGTKVVATNNEKVEVTIKVEEHKVTVLFDGDEIAGTSKSFAYDNEGHTFVVETVPEATITYYINGDPVDASEINNKATSIIKGEKTYVIKYIVTPKENGYKPTEGEFTVEITKPVPEVEVVDYVTGKKLVLVYTDTDNVFFAYDGDIMIDVTKSGYTLNNSGTPHKHVFGFVTDGIVGGDLDTYKANISHLYGDNTMYFTIDLYNENVNFDKDDEGKEIFDIRDITTAYAVYNVNEIAFSEVKYQKQILKSDIQKDKDVDFEDANLVVEKVYPTNTTN